MNAAILNAGSGAWAFEALAQNLSRAFGVPVSSTPALNNYVLGWDADDLPLGRSFIPFDSIYLATDKREIARVFNQHQVPSPTTVLLDDETTLRAFLRRYSAQLWVLKWPTGCDGAGHRILDADGPLPDDWPRPFVVQRFIEMERPEVFRLYGVAGELFGWNARRFAPNIENPDPFVAHARGAFYETAGIAPNAAIDVAQRALHATGLSDSFGCVDLLRDQNGSWLALEVNTDGRWMHVDRATLPAIADEIEARLAHAFGEWSEM